jgi:hypothetical protein
VADLSIWEILNIIQTQYPDALPILAKPGVLKVYCDFLNSKQGTSPWSDQQLQAALRGTEYYQSTDQTARTWDILQATDPASAAQKAAQAKQWVDDAQAATGIKLDTTGGLASAGFAFLAKATAEGWTQDQIKYQLIAQAGGQANGGQIADATTQVKALAEQYGVPLSDQAAMHWGEQLTSGAIDQNAVKGYLVEQAKSLFPGLTAALDAGQTVAQYADPYKQIAAQNLNINPNDINWTDPKWQAALNQVDPKTGARVSMSLDQWQKTIRSDPTYGYDQTSQAQQSASQLTTQLAQRFGAI